VDDVLHLACDFWQGGLVLIFTVVLLDGNIGDAKVVLQTLFNVIRGLSGLFVGVIFLDLARKKSKLHCPAAH
jgi:hypothetical protein